MKLHRASVTTSGRAQFLEGEQELKLEPKVSTDEKMNFEQFRSHVILMQSLWGVYA
jgi:hypothetical protein